MAITSPGSASIGIEAETDLIADLEHGLDLSQHFGASE